MKLCETCRATKKRNDTFEALNNLETELIHLESLCDIIKGMDVAGTPPLYLYHRIAEHVEHVRTHFGAAWDVVFDKSGN